MKYAVLSDIHSNYEALEAALKRLAPLNIDAYAFCGDLVGYGPDPEICAQTVKKLKNFIPVMGNHDMCLFNNDFFKWFSDYAKESIKFTAAHLSENSKKFIHSFPDQYHGKDFAMVHGSFFDNFRDYLLSAEQFILNLDKWAGSVCFVGHSHVPFIMSYKSDHMPQIDVFLGNDVTIKMMPGLRYMINPGSIGQQRDANHMASFGVYDSEKRTFRLLRAPYDIEAVQKKMRAAKLPDILSNRLTKGN
jgi:predicted phosphodiesterase